MSSEIPICVPEITPPDVEAVTDALRSRVLVNGPRGEEFGSAVAKIAGRAHGVALSSGTAAVHSMLLAAGVGEGDEVITSPFSYIANANCILLAGARPVFVDINSKTLNLDASKLEAAITPKTRAILAVEALGHPGGMEEIEQIARRHELPLLENACESLGATLQTRAIGSFGRASCFSFCSGQVVTSGEGGVVVTDDDRFAALCRSVRDQGRDDSDGLVHQRLGFNYRLCELNAALGLSQVSRLSHILEKRRAAVRDYFERLIESRYFILPTIPDDISMSWFIFAVRLNDLFEPGDRDTIIKHLRADGVGCGNHFPPAHLQPHIKERLNTQRGDFPVAEYVSERMIALPLFTAITREQIGRVCEVLDDAVEKVLMGRCKGRF